MNKPHTVVTKDYPENLSGGIMICGIDFGFSQEDERQEATAAGPVVAEPPSFFSDATVRATDRFRRILLSWLASWGVELKTVPGTEALKEKTFFQTNWIDQQNRSNVGPVQLLLENAGGFLSLLEARRAKVIVFCGSNLERPNMSEPVAS